MYFFYWQNSDAGKKKQKKPSQKESLRTYPTPKIPAKNFRTGDHEGLIPGTEYAPGVYYTKDRIWAFTDKKGNIVTKAL